MDILKANVSMSIKDISHRLGVSEMTVRRDCNELSKTGKLTKKNGVAYYISINSNLAAIKKMLGSTASTYVNEDDVIFVNSSTTAFQVIKALLNKKVTIITNNCNAASLVSNHNIATIVLSGGNISTNGITTGDIANHTFQSMRANVGIIGCAGISVDQGISTPKIEEATINKTIIRNSKKLIVVADHTKFNNFSNFTIGKISDIDILITDKIPDSKTLEMLKQSNTTVNYMN